MPPSTATQVRPGSRLTAPTRYSVTPARPTRHRPGSSQTSGAGSPAATNDSRAVAAAARASSAASGTSSSGWWRIPKPPPRSATRASQPSSSRHAAANAARRLIVSACAVKSGSCEPTWTWRPRTSRPRASASDDGDARLRRRQAELRAVMPRDDRLVRVGVDTERDADEDAPDARGCRERGLVGRVEHDRRVVFGGVAEQRVVLVVPVHDELGSGEPGAARERELARRGDVGADALVAEESQHGDVRKRLRSVEDTALRHRPPLAAPGPVAESSPRSRRRAACRIDLPARRPNAAERRAHPRRSARSPGRDRASADFAWYRFRLVKQLLP